MKRPLGHRFKELNSLALTLDLGGYSSEMLYWGYIEPLYWRNYRHIHSFFEVCYAFQGSGQFRIGTTQIEVNRGDLFIARPSQPHDIISSQKDPLGIYFWAHTLIPQALHGQGGTVDPLHLLFENYATSIRHCGRGNRALLQIIESLTREISEKKAGYQLKIHGLATNLLIETARSGCHHEMLAAVAQEPADSHEGSAIVLQIKRYLQDNYKRPIQLKEIAAQVHLSERHICRLFGQATGLSIQQYLAIIRIGVAKQMLLDQSSPVAQIAEATGFTDPRYFSTFFRRYTGDTPTGFRQKGGTEFLAQVEPRDIEPRDIEPRDIEPRDIEPRDVEPRDVEPRDIK